METTAAPLLPDSQLANPVVLPVGERANPEEFRASLDAVRSVQETARSRARRETHRARMITVVVLAGVGIVAWNISSRRSHRAQVIAAPSVAPAAVVATPSPTPTPPVEAPPATRPAPAVAAPAIDPAAAAEDAAACDAAFAEHRWQVVAPACAAAFKARPQNSALAMRVAQAQHRRGYVADAGDWARTAIELDPTSAEAFVILARAEVAAGKPGAAATAYRRYLLLAPRGWHASEARRALTP